MGITLSMTGAFRETGASFFFVPKGALTHHLVVASFISLDPPQSGRSRSLRCSSSPHKAGFAGVPCSAVVSFPSVGPCALRGGSRSLRRAPDNAAELAVSVVIACAAGRRLSPHLHRRCKSLSLPWDNLPPTCDKPATAQGTPFGCGSFVAEMDDAIPHRPFSFACAKRNKNASLRGAERT